MNKIPRPQHTIVFLAVVAAFASSGQTFAAEKKEARVTQVVRDVRLLSSRSAARPASLNEDVREGTAVRTGVQSLAELTYTDQTLTRLGANTVFSFGPGARNFDLTSGAVLVAVPPDGGTAHVKTAAVTAAISGGVLMAESHQNSWRKFIVLEGTGVITLIGSGKTLTLLPGQILTLPPGAKNFGGVHNIDLKKLTDKSRLLRTGKTPPWVKQLVQTQIQKQQTSPPKGGLSDPSGFDAIDQRAAAQQPAQIPTKSRPPG